MWKQYKTDTCMTDIDLTACRSALGKLNWLATYSQPDLCHEVSDYTSMFKHRCVDSITQNDKAIRKVKKISSQVTLLNLGKLFACKIIVYSDASFTNLSNGNSQDQYYIIHLVGKNGMSDPISWQSERIKRVAKNPQKTQDFGYDGYS